MKQKAEIILDSLSEKFGNLPAFQKSKLESEYDKWPEERIEQMAVDIFKRTVREHPEFDDEIRGKIYKTIRNSVIEIKMKSFVACVVRQ